MCPPNLAQGTSEEAAFRFGWNPVLSCGGDTGATGVVASPVYSPNGLVYVGSTDSYFYAVENRTGAVRWAMFADGPVQSSAAVDEDGKLFFATDAGTIHQIGGPAGGSMTKGERSRLGEGVGFRERDEERNAARDARDVVRRVSRERRDTWFG